MRSVGKTYYLYIGRGSGFEGLWLSEEKPESFLRKRDTFLEYIRKFLSATQFIELEVDSQDRIVLLKYQKWRVENTLALFYKGRRLYFSHHFFNSKTKTMQTLKSWTTQSEDSEKMNMDVFDDVGRKSLEHKELKKMKEIQEISDLIEIEKKQALKNPILKKSTSFIIRKMKKIEQDLEKVRLWKDLQAYANRSEDFSLLDKKSLLVGIKINFKEKEHFKRRNEIYAKTKKLKKAEGILEERLHATKLLSANKLEDTLNLENSLVPVKPFWNQREVALAQRQPILKTKQDYKVYKFDGMLVAVGTSANGNDEMRKSWGKKDDIWFHLESVKSPHIIAKLETRTLDEETLRLIGSVLIEYSDFDFSEASMIFTHVKNLKGVRGAAGKVTYKKEKHIKVECIDSWRNELSIIYK